MKIMAKLLSCLFLFGVFALPGKVCPNAHDRVVRVPVENSDRPACHRSPSGDTADSGTPCETMVCCLVPDMTRGGVSAVLLPAPDHSDVVVLPVRPPLLVSPVLVCRTFFDAQAPPGSFGSFSSHASPRGPPLA